MNLGQLTEHLAKRILRRADLDSDPEMLPLVVNAGHQQLMMDGNFRCMETHTPITYPANTDIYGVPVPLVYYAGPPIVLACKSLRNVWNTNNGVASTPIIPATEMEVNNLRNIKNQCQKVAPTSADTQQRWYEKEQQICLLYGSNADANLIVDYYGFLPDYALPGDHDYFSDQLWLCLLYAAAWQGSTSLFEDSRASQFMGIYQQLLKQAIETDRQIKAGGVQPRVIVAPTTSTVSQPGAVGAQ